MREIGGNGQRAAGNGQRAAASTVASVVASVELTLGLSVQPDREVQESTGDPTK